MRTNRPRPAWKHHTAAVARFLRARQAQNISRYLDHMQGPDGHTDQAEPTEAYAERLVSGVIATIEEDAAAASALPTDPAAGEPNTGEKVLFDIALAEVANCADVPEDRLQQIVLTAAAMHNSLAHHLAHHLAERMAQDAELHLGQVIEKVQRSHEEERRQTTRELHDRAGSWLTVAHRQLEMTIEEQDGTVDPTVAERLELAFDAIREAMHGLRAATDQLRRSEVTSLVTALGMALDALAAPGPDIFLAGVRRRTVGHQRGQGRGVPHPAGGRQQRRGARPAAALAGRRVHRSGRAARVRDRRRQRFPHRGRRTIRGHRPVLHA